MRIIDHCFVLRHLLGQPPKRNELGDQAMYLNGLCLLLNLLMTMCHDKLFWGVVVNICFIVMHFDAHTYGSTDLVCIG